jgi:hypothetical protein
MPKFDEIDSRHSRAICCEIAERLHVLLSNDPASLPVALSRQLEQLREMDEQSPSIVPLAKNDCF